MPRGVVAHVTAAEPAAWRKAVRNLGNLLDAGEPAAGELAVIVHGDALGLVLEGSPVAAELAELLERGVSVRACENTLAGRGATAEDLLPGVDVVPSGVAEAVRLQREGRAYLKLP